MTEITDCEVCGNTKLVSVLNLGRHPLCDDLVRIESPRTCTEYPIEVLYCTECKTAHQRFQVDKSALFPETYHYRARFTADVLNGMQDLVDSCEKHLGSLQNISVLDIGCNDGSLLDCFRKLGAKTYGIEPTGAALEAQAKGHVVQKAFFCEATAKQFVASFGKPKVVTFTNVFAHIENLGELLSSLKILMGPDSSLVIENHYLGSILRKNQFDTFYHEHPRTYSLSSFIKIAERLNLSITSASFPERYGGNIRVFIEKTTASLPEFKTVLEQERQFIALFKDMSDRIHQWVINKKRQIEQLASKNGKLPAKAFPGRAAILIKLLGVDENLIEAVYEKPGSKKIGHFVPGSRIPIRSDDELFTQLEKSKPYLNLAWHIPTEISQYMREKGFDGPLLNIIDPQDFA